MPTALSVDSLRTEHKVNPLGTDVTQPRLGWKLRSTGRDVMQTAYQITVSSNENGGSDLWDSGKVNSSQSVDVKYGGKPLTSGLRAHWRVKIWDNQGNVAESQPAWWEMGLLQKSDWNAQWIGGHLEGGPRTSVPPPYLRKGFRLDKPVASARLYVTALGLHEFHINGELASEDVFRPGWTEYRIRVQYDTYDVTKLLKQGDNAIGAIMGDGWYCGYVAADDRQKYGERPKLLAQIIVRFQDGSTQTIVTDDSWKTTLGPLLEADLIMGESYDARRELTGWDAADYDDKNWDRALVFPSPDIMITASPGTPVRRIKEIKPIAEPRHFGGWPVGSWQFDFGQNLVGRLRIKVKGKKGDTLKIRHAEVLKDNKPDGRLYTDNLRTARATDYYTLKGDGEEVWEPRFTFHGFRYAEITGVKEMTAENVTAIVLHNEMPVTGSFECSDALVNQLQHNIQWGQRGNFLEVPTDCPQRDERLGWTGDAQAFCRTAMFNMDVQSFFSKWFRDIREAQAGSGSIPAVIPHTGSFGASSDGGPGWADACTIVPWTQYLVYGDRRALADHYECVKNFMAFEAKYSEDGIRCKPGFKYSEGAWDGFGDWLSTDAPGRRWNGGTPMDLIGTAFYAFSTSIAAQMARALAKPDEAAKHDEQFERIKTAFIKRFVTADGLVAGRSQTSAVLALHFGLLPEEARGTVADWLVREIASHGNKLSTGFLGTPYIQHALTQAGRIDIAYKLLMQKEWPSWLYAPAHGATTIWERWDGWTHDRGFQDAGMNSFNHYAYGAVGDWLYGVVAGIDVDPEKPGYEHIIFRPHPGKELTHVKAELESVRGKIRAGWRTNGDRFEYEVEVPPNATATVYLPSKDGAQVMHDGKPVTGQRDGDQVAIRIGSGVHQFSASL